MYAIRPLVQFALSAFIMQGQRAQAPQQGTAADGVRAVQSLVAQRRYQEAARTAEQLVKDHKGEPEAWMALAGVHLAPDWAFRHDARAESAAQRALKLAGRRNDVVAALALAKYRQTKYDECLPLVAELVDAVPPKVAGGGLCDLLVVRADVTLRRGAGDPAAKEQALQDLERALAASPASPSVRTMRAELRLQDGRLEEALADLKVALHSAPGSKQVHYGLQTALARLGRKDEARRHQEIWKRLNRLTDSQSALNAPQPPERREILRELRDINPLDAGRRLELAQLELELGDPAAALSECESLLSVSPRWQAALWLRDQAQRAKAKADGAGDGK